MRNNIYLGLLLTVFGCGVVLEEDISGDEVNLVTPSDSAFILGDSASFLWDHLEEAREYQFRLVSPNFNQTVLLIADSITSGNFLTFPLNPGNYEWSVRALNDGYSTESFVRSFSIDTVEYADLSEVQIEILAPVDEVQIVAKSVTLWWADVLADYHLSVVTPSFDLAESVILDSIVTSSKFEFEPIPGEYEWQVQAFNRSSRSERFRSSFSFDTIEVIDISNQEVEFLLPVAGTFIVGSEVDIVWNDVDGASNYQLQVVTPTFNNPSSFVLDTTLTSSNIKLTLLPDSYEISLFASNRISQTSTSYVNFEIDSIQTVDISNMTVSLNAPGIDTIPSGEISFWWDEVAGAERYELIIVSPGFENIQRLLLDVELENDQYVHSLDSGLYEWSVRGFNRDYTTEQTTRVLKVD